MRRAWRVYHALRFRSERATPDENAMKPTAGGQPTQKRTHRRTRRPLVSVCIVNWNCRDLLCACLRSLAIPAEVRLEVDRRGQRLDRRGC